MKKHICIMYLIIFVFILMILFLYILLVKIYLLYTAVYLIPFDSYCYSGVSKRSKIRNLII